MGVYKLYLVAHESGMKENIPTPTLSHTISVMTKL